MSTNKVNRWVQLKLYLTELENSFAEKYHFEFKMDAYACRNIVALIQAIYQRMLQLEEEKKRANIQREMP